MNNSKKKKDAVTSFFKFFVDQWLGAMIAVFGLMLLVGLMWLIDYLYEEATGERLNQDWLWLPLLAIVAIWLLNNWIRRRRAAEKPEAYFDDDANKPHD